MSTSFDFNFIDNTYLILETFGTNLFLLNKNWTRETNNGKLKTILSEQNDIFAC